MVAERWAGIGITYKRMVEYFTERAQSKQMVLSR